MSQLCGPSGHPVQRPVAVKPLEEELSTDA